MIFYVYAIQAPSGRVYIGQSQNVEERLSLHNAGSVKSTKAQGPWHILKTVQFETREQARYFEWCLKRSKGKRDKWLAEE